MTILRNIQFPTRSRSAIIQEYFCESVYTTVSLRQVTDHTDRYLADLRSTIARRNASGTIPHRSVSNIDPSLTIVLCRFVKTQLAMHVYQKARPFVKDLIEAVKPDRSPTNSILISTHDEFAVTFTSAESSRRGVSRAEAMSLYAGLSRSCVVIAAVKHHRLIVRERREERTMLGKTRSVWLLLVVVDVDDDRARLPAPPFSPSKRATSEERPHTDEGCDGRINTRWCRHPLVETCGRTTLECLASLSTLSVAPFSIEKRMRHGKWEHTSTHAPFRPSVLPRGRDNRESRAGQLIGPDVTEKRCRWRVSQKHSRHF